MTRRRTRRGEGPGRLYIIGGGEDRKHDKVVLSRLVELSGGESARIVVLTAASTLHDEMWELYDKAFGALGVKQRSPLFVASRDDANDEARAAAVLNADVVFMTGGNQKRLLALIGGTRLDEAMHRALREHGTCIAGTSAGASAISEHMLFAAGSDDLLPRRGSAQLAAGLGFLRRVVIDQHFSERQRLGRLLSVVAQNPSLFGVGIDEDTALMVEPGEAIEVVGEGAVTLIDGRHMLSNYLDVDEQERLELTNVTLHLLPAGARYALDGGKTGERALPATLRDVLAAMSGDGGLPSAGAAPSGEGAA